MKQDVLQQYIYIETLLASKIISEEIVPLNKYIIDYENDNIIIK